MPDPFPLHRYGNTRIVRTPEELARVRTIVGWPPKLDPMAFTSQMAIDKTVELRAALQDLQGKCHFATQDIDDARHLLCFLRARRFNVSKAEALWRKACAWRQANDPIVLLDTFCVDPLLDRYSTGGPWGQDAEGSPVFIDPIGRIYFKEILEKGDAATLKKSFVDFEILKNEMIIAEMDFQTLRDGKIHTQATIILDLYDLGFRHIAPAAQGVIKEIVEMGDTYYPERVKQMICVNAPSIVWAIYKVISLFFDENTREKVIIDNGLDALAKAGFTPAMLPPFLGGIKEDVHRAIRMGGKPGE